MNKKLAIFGFIAVWVVSIAAIVFVMLPKLFTDNKDTGVNTLKSDKLNNSSTEKANTKADDSFFYDKKVFVRHTNKNNEDSTVVPAKVILVRKNIFFKPPDVKLIPVVKPPTVVPKKANNSGFDIKPVPTN